MKEKKLKTLVKTIFGSTLFGTNTPESDMDYKAVIVPSARDLLLNQYKDVENTSTGGKNKKNTKEDTDLEVFTLKRFLEDAREGQTFALDMLFTPEDKILESSPEWDFIVKNRHKLIHSNVSSFVGFAINQANEYKEKGERLKKLKKLNACLREYNKNRKLQDCLEDLKKFDFVSFVEKPANKESDKLITYLVVFDKMAALNSSIKIALKTYESMAKEYGARAKAAEEDGIDFKSKYHALRVAHEALELLTTGHITFPRPEAPLLLSIRNGELTEDEVDKLIKEKLAEVKEAEKTTSLKKSVNAKFWEDFVYAVYSKEVKSS